MSRDHNIFGQLDRKLQTWKTADSMRRITAIDAHTAGEPLRIITDGVPMPDGASVLQRRRFCKEHLDDYRTILMREPRGHADMYGCLVVPGDSEDSDFGIIFLHNEGYSSMCGHGIIAVCKVMLTIGAVEKLAPLTTVNIDAPAGRIKASVHIDDNGDVGMVAFENVPSFAVSLDQSVNTTQYGKIHYDLAFGGAYYAYVDIGQFDFDLSPSDSQSLIIAGRAIKRILESSIAIQHPFESDLSFLYGVIFHGPAEQPDHHRRHVCVFADGQIDRSPTGTGVSGYAALEHTRGRMQSNAPMTIESILGTTFDVSVMDQVEFAGVPAIIPRVAGQAFVTGIHEFVMEPDDPLVNGFLLR